VHGVSIYLCLELIACISIKWGGGDTDTGSKGLEIQGVGISSLNPSLILLLCSCLSLGYVHRPVTKEMVVLAKILKLRSRQET